MCMNRPSPVIPMMMLLVLVAAGMMFALPKFSAPAAEMHLVEEMDIGIVEARVIEVVSGHAWQGHGIEVNEAFRCLNKYGSTKSFKTFGFTDHNSGNLIPTNLWMCLDPVTRQWYAVVTTYFERVGTDKVARLVTAYKVGSDIFKTIEDFLQYIASKWGAVAIPYTIGKEEILLRPH